MSAEELNAQLLSQLECPVCFETCLPPIYMCRNGHIVCAKCQAQLKACSTCRASGKPTLQCVPFEKMAALLKLPCTNHPSGCKLKFSMDELAKHLPTCDHGFQCYVCLVFRGTTLGLKEHVLNEHPKNYLSIPSDGSISRWSNLPMTKYFHDKTFNYMYAFNDDIFWLESKYISTTRILSRILRIVSNETKDASRYFCSSEFKTKDERSEFKVFHQADVLLLTDDASNGRMEIFLPACVIDSNEDGNIKYTFKISLKTKGVGSYSK